MLRYLTFLIALFFFTTGKGQLIIKPESDPVKLARNLVGNGVYVSNVTLKAAPLSTGFFQNKGGTSIQMDSGIVLSSGRVLTQGNFGLNGAQAMLASNSMLTDGDADLTLLAGQPTSDAAILEFDFVPVGDIVKFTYVFSSEEYPSYVCSNYNDVFAFFIQGPGIIGKKNLALIPGTNVPVAINSINSGTPGGAFPLINCTNMGVGSPFTQYYTSNTGNAFFTHNGHTVTLTATVQVVPCQTYHLKIAISDAGVGPNGSLDRILDSGVFLEAKSLNSAAVKIINLGPTDNGAPYLAEGCTPGRIRLVSSSKKATAQQVNLFYGGQATNGTDVNLLPATINIPANDSIVDIILTAFPDMTNEGSEDLKIYAAMGCLTAGFFSDSLTINVRDYDTLSIQPSGVVGFCKNTPLQIVADPSFDTYSWTPVVGVNNPQIHNPVLYPASDTSYTCVATRGSCRALDSVKIKTKNLELLSSTGISCANSPNGVITVTGGPLWARPLAFKIGNGAFSTDSVFTNLAAATYTIIAKDATGCEDTLLVNLVQTHPALTLKDSIVNASCRGTGGRVMLNATGGVPPYLFSVDNSPYTSLQTYNLNAGQYTIAVKDANNCSVGGTIAILREDTITMTAAITAATCSITPDGNVSITGSGGSGIYEYSLNGVQYQPSNIFVVPAGPLKVYVRDNNSCVGTSNFIVPQINHLTIDLADSASICEGTQYQMQVTSNGTGFTWTNPTMLNDPNSMNPVASPAASAWFRVSGTLGTCTRSDSIFLRVHQAPLPGAGNDTFACEGESVMLQGTGGTQYSWHPAASFTNPNIPNPTITPKSTSTYYITVVDSRGCRSLVADSVKVKVVPPVKMFAGRDTIISSAQTLPLSAIDIFNRGVTSYVWSPSTGLNDPFDKDPVATIYQDITYTVTGTTPEGCSGQDEISIRAIKGPELYVPSAFTPNNDRLNDYAKVIPVGIPKLNYFRIYNRYGDLVFSTNDPGKGWDGRIRGELQKTEIFVWVAEGVDVDGNVVRRKGTITLLR